MLTAAAAFDCVDDVAANDELIIALYIQDRTLTLLVNLVSLAGGPMVRGYGTVVEVSLLVHHVGLDLGAVVPAEGEGPGVLRSELVLPGAPEVHGVHQGQPGHAAEVLRRQQLVDLT